jgi:hypothetical protein
MSAMKDAQLEAQEKLSVEWRQVYMLLDREKKAKRKNYAALNDYMIRLRSIEEQAKEMNIELIIR